MPATKPAVLSLHPTLVTDPPFLFVFYKDPEAIHMAAFTAPDPLNSEGYTARHDLKGPPTFHP